MKRVDSILLATTLVVGCSSGGESVSIPTPSATPTTTPTPLPTNTPAVPSVNAFVQPGTVGYTGSQAALTSYAPGGAAPPGCTWQSYGIRCDQADLTLDHVSITGGLYWTGTGNLTISNSVVLGGLAWYSIYAASANNSANSVIAVTDSTVGWASGYTLPSNVDVGPIWSAGSQAFVIERCDISGMPQGIDPGANSVIDSNYIHGLVQNNPVTPTHLDGVYSQGGANILIQRNYVDAPIRSDVTAALFIQDRTGTDTGIKVYANYLNGGAYILRNQTGVNVDVENNTFGNSLYGYVGDLSGYPGTYGTWSGNIAVSGATIPHP